MKVLRDFDNRLCNRNEYTIEVNHLNNRTPDRNEIKKKVSELTNHPENLISVEGTFTKKRQRTRDQVRNIQNTR